MKMPRQTMRRSEKIDQIARDVHRLNRADAQAFERRALANLTQQIPERHTRKKIPAVATEINSAHHDFLESARAQLVDFTQHFARRKAATRSPHKRNHTIRTAIVAAVLNLQNWTGVAVFTSQNRRSQPSATPIDACCKNFGR